MILRYVSGALAAIVLICGVPTLDRVHAQTRDSSLLPPEKSGVITVAGCLQLGGTNGDKYLLTNPTLGPIANVPEQTCDATVDDRALDLKDTAEHGMNQSMLGRWIEINGRLEKETDADLTNLRELEVRSFRILPVVPPPPVIPPRAEAPPAPVPQPLAEQQPVTPPVETAAPPEEQPIGTTGTVESTLPKTASPSPAIGLLGLLSLAGGLGLRSYRSRERG